MVMVMVLECERMDWHCGCTRWVCFWFCGGGNIGCAVGWRYEVEVEVIYIECERMD